MPAEKEKIVEKYKEIYRISGFYGLLGLAKRGQIKKYNIDYKQVRKYFRSHQEAINRIFGFDINAEIRPAEAEKFREHAFSYFRNYGFCKATELLKEEFGVGAMEVIQLHSEFLERYSRQQDSTLHNRIDFEKSIEEIKLKLIEKRKDLCWSGNEKIKKDIEELENKLLEINAAIICKEHLDSAYEDTLNKKLHVLGIKHEHNVKYPEQYERSRNTNSFPRCDFKIGEFWIEYAGLWKLNALNTNNPFDFAKYKQDIEEKRKIAIRNNIKLVILYPFESEFEKENKLEMIIREGTKSKIKISKLYALPKCRSLGNAEQESHVSDEVCSSAA